MQVEDTSKCPQGCGWRSDPLGNKEFQVRQLNGHKAQCPRRLNNKRTYSTQNVDDLLAGHDQLSGYSSLSSSSSSRMREESNPRENELAQWEDYCMNAFLHQDRDDEDHIGQDPGRHMLFPSTKVLCMQNRIAEVQAASFTASFRVRAHRRDIDNAEMIKTTAEDYVELASLGENLAVSGSQGNLLLKTFNSIMKRHDIPFQLPKEWRTINRSVISNSKNFCSVRRIRIKYDETYFGREDVNGKLMKGPTGIALNLLELVAERLQNCDPKTFHGIPLEQKDKNGVSVTSSFPTGLFMKRAYESRLHQMQGETHDAEGRPYVLVCFGISKDKAAMNSTRNVSATPVVMSILNLLSPLASEKTTLIGITPSDDQYSKATLLKHLEDVMHCKRKGERHRVLQASERAILFQYYDELLAPLYALENQAFITRIGPNEDPDSYEAIAFPIITFFYGDNQDLDDLASVSAGRNGMKCRVCEETNCHKFVGPSAPIRNHSFMKQKTQELAELDKKLFVDSKRQTRCRPKTGPEIALQNIRDEHNIISGKNICYDIAETCYKNQVHDGYHAMTPPDKLHTVLKGILLAIISWCVQCLYALQLINPDLYGSIIARIDYIFIHFPRWQSILPFRILDMPLGISTYFTDKRSNTYKGTGMSTLSLPGWRMPGIAFMLLYAIGESAGGIVPAMVETLKIPMRQDWNVLHTMVNALQSVLDMVSFSKRLEGFTAANFQLLSKITTLTQAHAQILFEMRNQLIDCSKRLPPRECAIRLFRGHKHHLISHLVEFMMLYGADDNIFDTQLPEHFHILVKGLYGRSSKVKADGACFEEMAERMAVRLHLDRLKRKMENESKSRAAIAAANDESEDDGTDSDEEVEAAANAAAADVAAANGRAAASAVVINGGAAVAVDHVANGGVIAVGASADVIKQVYEFKHVRNFQKDALYIDLDVGLFRVENFKTARTPGMKKQCSQYMHPFLNMDTFTELFYSQSLDGLCRTMVNEYATVPKSDVRIELLSGLSCKGIASFGIPAFKIYANRLVPKNRRAQKDNRVYHPNFSFLEVNFGKGSVERKVVVRVLAIVRVYRDTGVESRKSLGEIRLIVANLRQNMDRRSNVLPARQLQYAWNPAVPARPAQNGNPATLRRLEGLEIDLIELSCVVLPACVIPQFRYDWNAHKHEEFADLINNGTKIYKTYLFYHVPIHQICEFDVVNTALRSEVLDNSLTDEEKEDAEMESLRRVEYCTRAGDMPMYLTSTQLLRLQELLVESRGGAESDDSDKENGRADTDEEEEAEI